MLQKLQNPALGLLIIRIVVGAAFIYHGYTKIAGLTGTVGFFGQMGIPAFITYLVVIAEFFGGIAILIGLYTRIAALAIGVVMIGAIVLVHLERGGIELPLVFLATTLGLAFLGAGQYSIDAKQERA